MRDELKDDFQGCERLGSPVDGNKGEESMLNLIPLAGGGRIMCHRDREVFGVGKVLKLFLPQPISHAIGAAAISGDEQLALAGIERFT